MSFQTLMAVATLGWAAATPAGPVAAPGIALEVPIVRQAPARCGQAALEMVLLYHGADSAAVREADRAYDRALRGSLITDLAAAARRAGYDATVATLAPDSLVALLAAGVPPIVLYQNGRAPLTVAHYAVVTAWDPAREVFTLHDGRARPRILGRTDLAKRWRTAGSQGLIIRRRSP
jgi:ABC-type bacteriocin/lantibiotic exporter with double-glycine peptidase domain